MIYNFELKTSWKDDFLNITSLVNKKIIESWIENSVCLIYTPHTTCWITINEWFDPDVMFDIKKFLKDKIPQNYKFSHMEWNSSSHIKSSLIWVSKNLIIQDNSLFLGQWQQLFFLEFDGPRNREFFLKILD